MKKFSFVSLLSIVLFASNAQADTYVNGYFKKVYYLYRYNRDKKMDDKLMYILNNDIQIITHFV